MTERKRLVPLLWAALCALGFTILAVLVTRDRSPLDSLDQIGKAGEDWADDHTVLVDVLRWIEILFGGVAMTVITTLLAVHPARPPTPAGDGLRGRVDDRDLAADHGVQAVAGPQPTRTGRPSTSTLLTTRSFPSGHASSIAAFVGVLHRAHLDLRTPLEHAPRRSSRCSSWSG